MAREESYRITGRTNGQVVNGEKVPMLHDLSIDVDPSRVHIEMTGLGGGVTDAIDEWHPMIRRHYGKVKALQERTAYRNRPITSYWKDKPTKKTKASPGKSGPPKGLVICPRCQVGDADCPLCDGAGAVSERQAEQWEIDSKR